MLFRSVSSTLLVAVLLVSPAAAADDHASNWIKFFVGNWSRETEIKTKEGVEKSKMEWTGKTASGGKAITSSAKDSKGIEQASLMGLHEKGAFEYGTNSSGANWRILYTEINARRMKGTLSGTWDDGTPGSGELIIEKLDKGYIAVWKFTLENKDKDVIAGKEINTRVKAKK